MLPFTQTKPTTQGASRDNCAGFRGIVLGEDLVWLHAFFGEGGRKGILLDSIYSSVDLFCPLFQQLVRGFLQNISPLWELFRNSYFRIIHTEIWFSSPYSVSLKQSQCLRRSSGKASLGSNPGEGIQSATCVGTAQSSPRLVQKHVKASQKFILAGHFASFGSTRVTLRMELMQDTMCRSGAKLLRAISGTPMVRFSHKKLGAMDFYRVEETRMVEWCCALNHISPVRTVLFLTQFHSPQTHSHYKGQKSLLFHGRSSSFHHWGSAGKHSVESGCGIERQN